MGLGLSANRQIRGSQKILRDGHRTVGLALFRVFVDGKMENYAKFMEKNTRLILLSSVSLNNNMPYFVNMWQQCERKLPNQNMILWHICTVAKTLLSAFVSAVVE